MKRIVAVLAVMVLGAQVFRPERTNPPIDPTKEYRAPAHVQPILDRACNDCHSNRTRWPWYSHVTPVAHFLVDHVNEGREELSFSEFRAYPPKDAAHKMEEICGEIKEGHMPLREYLWLHPSARLSDADRQTLCEWSAAEHRRLSGT